MQNKFVKIQRANSTPIQYDALYERTEKLDGANFSFYVNKSGVLVFRSRNQELGESTGNFTRAVEYIQSLDHKFKKGLIYFGECMKKHTIFYGETPAVIGFAVFDVSHEVYVDDWHIMFSEAGIETPSRKILWGRDILKDVAEYLDTASLFGDSGAIQEGFVYKSYKTQEFIKFVREQFKEDNREVFGGGFVPEDDTGKIVARFGTFGRIEKHAHKLKMEFEMPIDMPMMGYLPKIVCEDIITEEHMTIYNKYKIVDYKKFRKLIAEECRNYLKQVHWSEWE